MYKLKIVKSTAFTVDEKEHTHYTAAFKGRIFGVSTLRFEGDEDVLKVIEENGKEYVTINCDIEVLKNSSTNELTGETRNFLDIVPKAGIELAEF